MAIAVAAVMIAAFAVGALSDRAASSTFMQTGRIVQGRVPTNGDEAAGTGSVLAQEGSVVATEGQPALLDAPDERIIRTATVRVEVEEGSFDDAWERAFGVPERFGGRVLSTERRSDDQEGSDAPPSGTLSLRVPVDRFEDALVAVRGIGEVLLDRSSSQDVTEEYVDLGSRLRHLRAQETALLRLMTRADSVSDTLKVQGELSKVQAEIEQVTGRLNFLDARTLFSTITLTLGEPGAFARSPGSAIRGNEPSFAQAWGTAIEGLERMATAGLILVMWSLPFAGGFAIGFWIWRVRKPAPQV